MKTLYQRLLLVIAGATHKELAAHIHYLRVENQILRSKLPARVTVTAQEKNRLVTFGSKLGKTLGDLVSIVHPDTMRRWIRESKKQPAKPVRRGRPRTKDQIRELIVKLGRENNWGYTRILGELRKLGVKRISRNTVKNILKQHGLEPGPNRGAGSWDDFLKRHASTLWQCDFLSKKVLTWKGFRDIFVLAFIHVESRKVWVAPATFHPNESWVKYQARAFVRHVERSGMEAKTVMHDRDTKFTRSFDEVLETNDVDVRITHYRSPNTNAYIERFVQTLQQECLDHFVVFGKQHMDHLVKEMVEHYHLERPHQGMGNEPLVKVVKLPARVVPVEKVVCRQRLGGLLKHYEKAA